MSLRDTVEFAHMAFGLVPKIINPIDGVLLVCKAFGVGDSKMFKVRNIQLVVGLPAVRIDNAVRNDLAVDNRD